MTNLHHVADSPFLLLLWLFPPNVKHLVWSIEQGAFTYPDLIPDQILSDRGPCTWAGPALVRTRFLVPKGTVYITRFGPDQIGFVNEVIITELKAALKSTYFKNPKNWNIRKICCNHHKIWATRLYHTVMLLKDADGIAKGVDPDQTAPLIWVCTVCPGLSVQKLRLITVIEELIIGHQILYIKIIHMTGI